MVCFGEVGKLKFRWLFNLLKKVELTTDMILNTDLGDTQSPCRYDEGSPLVQNNNVMPTAIGIMSRNNGCGTAGALSFDPTIYTRLSAYYSWLVSTAGPQPFPYIADQVNTKIDKVN